MSNSFKEYLKLVRIQRPNGESVPLVLTKQQETFADFMEWCKENGYQTSIPYGCRGNSKTLFNTLWEKYNKEKEN